MNYYHPFYTPYLQCMQYMAYNQQINPVQTYFNQYYNNFSYLPLGEKCQLQQTQEGHQNTKDTIVLKPVVKEESIEPIQQRIVHKKPKVENFEKKVHAKNKKTLEKSRVQKEGRNANSNLLRMFFRSLETRSQTLYQTIKKIIGKYSLSLTLEQVKEWLEINKMDHKNYIRISVVRKIFVRNNQEAQYSLVMRILLNQFLKKEAVSSYLTSKKIKKSSLEEIKCNYWVIRNILKQIYHS